MSPKPDDYKTLRPQLNTLLTQFYTIAKHESGYEKLPPKDIERVANQLEHDCVTINTHQHNTAPITLLPTEKVTIFQKVVRELQKQNQYFSSKAQQIHAEITAMNVSPPTPHSNQHF